MNRPYVTCHVLSSLDGKINGSLLWQQRQRAYLEANMEKSARK